MNNRDEPTPTTEEICDAEAKFAKLAALARAVETPEDQVALAGKLIDEHGFGPMEASIFIALERGGDRTTPRTTTAPL